MGGTQPGLAVADETDLLRVQLVRAEEEIASLRRWIVVVIATVVALAMVVGATWYVRHRPSDEERASIREVRAAVEDWRQLLVAAGGRQVSDAELVAHRVDPHAAHVRDFLAEAHDLATIPGATGLKVEYAGKTTFRTLPFGEVQAEVPFYEEVIGFQSSGGFGQLITFVRGADRKMHLVRALRELDDNLGYG